LADFKITSPRLRILRGSLDAPEVIEVQTLNPDLIAFDMTRARHKWPELKDAPFKWLTFIGWHAARREGAIPADLSYEAWEASTLEVTNLTDDDDTAGRGEAVDPTPPDPVPG
jgi:hypothetical protein